MRSRGLVRRGGAALLALSSGCGLLLLGASLSLVPGFGGPGSVVVAASSASDDTDRPGDAGQPIGQPSASDGWGSAGPHIAVIGGGIGGTSTAYHLRKLLGPTASIDLYEPGVIGGRVRTVRIGDRDYEAGGSIIHPKNKYMVDFCEEFGLKKRYSPSTLSGFYNGEEFVFTESTWTVVTLMRLLWRYGLDCLYIKSDVKAMLQSFSRIYDLQDSGQAFASPAQMLQAMGGEQFLALARRPLQEVLRSRGYSERFIEELASVAMRNNYGQSVNITAFAGMVSLAGVEPGLWAIHGGNKLVPEALLKASGAVWHRATVSAVRRLTAASYEVTARASGNGQASTARYDMVIVATPLTPGVGSHIEFQGFQPAPGPFGGRYQRTVASFVRGRPNPVAFGKPAGDTLPDVETTRNVSQNIRTLARNFPVDLTEDEAKTEDPAGEVYKLFAGDLLTEDQVKALFVSDDYRVSVDWLAYPHYTVDDEMPPFVMSEGVFYVNGIEWAASAMEMSAIGGRNAALLAKQHWEGMPTAADQDVKGTHHEL